ncbi:MAG: YcnI family protein [Actinomycetota bacterium]|nr:YcnI family protein [Actinomycetota bacterium]
MSSSLSRRLLAAGVVTAGLVLVPLSAADAHVTVRSDTAVTGRYAELTFKVPNEEATATTTKVVVTLPDKTPLVDVSVRPTPGWTVTVTDAKLATPVVVEGTTLTTAPHQVTWTATGDAAIAPGQYQTFAISGGPLPAPGVLMFPADQTYSDGMVVSWSEPTVSGQPEPEHPAPTVTVVAEPVIELAASSSDAVARWLAGAALVVAAAALGLLLVRRGSGAPAGPGNDQGPGKS